MFKPPKDLLDFVFSIPDSTSFKGSGKHLTWSLKRIGEEKGEHRIIDNNAGSNEVNSKSIQFHFGVLTICGN